MNKILPWEKLIQEDLTVWIRRDTSNIIIGKIMVISRFEHLGPYTILYKNQDYIIYASLEECFNLVNRKLKIDNYQIVKEKYSVML